jgi:hypothetical protein
MIVRLAAGISATALAALALMPPPVQAQTYRYWSYWTGGDQWTYSNRGPAFRSPPDGGVEGWRFVVSPRDGSQATPPGTASDYPQLCPGTAVAPAGQKRVAVVIDFGPPGIAPVGQTPPENTVTCLTVPTDATGLQTLQKAAELRFHTSGLICGIAGFPATECPGQAASGNTPTPSDTPTPVPQPPEVQPLPDTPVDDSLPAATDTPTSPAPPRSTGSPPPTDAPTPVALTASDPPGPAPGEAGVPAWVAAIGAAMIAALLGLAMLARRGRE